MGDAIAIRTHSLPWSPTPDTELVTTYDRYDVPLVGHLVQHGVDYLFWCVEGAVSDVSLWAYAWVAPDEVLQLDASEDFDPTFARIVADKAVVLAIYKEGEGILGSLSIDHPRAFDSLVDAARNQIRELNRTVGHEAAIA